MAYTAGAHRADSLGPNGGTSAALASTGDILWLAVSTDSGVTLVAGDISDSNSNTWVLVGTTPNGGFTRIHLFVAKNAVTGSGHTFTVTKASCYAAMCVFSASNSDTTSPTDQTNAAGTTGTSIASGSVTPSVDDEIVISCLADDNGGAITDPSGFTHLDTQAHIGSTSYGCSMAYKIQTTAGAENPSWTVASSTGITTAVGTFKSAGGGGGAAAQNLLTVTGAGS